MIKKALSFNFFLKWTFSDMLRKTTFWKIVVAPIAGKKLMPDEYTYTFSLYFLLLSAPFQNTGQTEIWK